MLLKDKVVVITGSTRGIGKGIALCCAKEGAHVVVSGTNPKLIESIVPEFKEQGYEISARICDVTKREDVENLMKFAYETYGKIDAVVANAGITDPIQFEDLTEEHWDTMLDINLKGIYLTDYAAFPYLKKNGGGRIINVSSDCGVEGWPYMPHYSAAKFGVRGMTQSLAKELGPYHINVNAICPGIIDTDIWVRGDALTVAITGEEIGSAWKSNVDRIPLGRPGYPEDIGKGVVMLLSEYADYINGTTLMIGGGSAVN